MSRTDRNLAVQGYCMSAEESHALRWGLRFPTALCLGLVVTGLALQSAVLILALVPVGAVAGWTPRHPFDLIWNHGLRHLSGAPELPPNPTPRRHAFKLATVWLLAVGLLFAFGQPTAALMLGGLLIAVCGLLTDHELLRAVDAARHLVASTRHRARLPPSRAANEEERWKRRVDTQELEAKVKDMYRHVAEQPQGKYHFELGRPLAERLGYPADVLDRDPRRGAASRSPGSATSSISPSSPRARASIDLGSGSGMDVFFAAEQVGAVRKRGRDRLHRRAAREGPANRATSPAIRRSSSARGASSSCRLRTASFDCVISNGVINLAPDKGAVFAEAARVLRPGGRLAIADIVSEQQMKESIVCDADLWASCIGGAAQVDAYREAIEGSGLRIEEIRDNPYEFISDRARDASAKYGVKSVSLLAIKPQ